MTSELYAFGSADIRVQFWFGMTKDGFGNVQRDDSKIVPVRRVICETNRDGSCYGIFELGTAVYDGKNDVFDNIELTSDMDIVIFPKKFVLDPLIKCENVRITRKQLEISAPSSTVYCKYYFSNRPDWKDHNLELPKESYNSSLDPLYRIARAVEDLKKSVVESNKKSLDSSFSDDNLVLTVEEFTDWKLNGIDPRKNKSGV
jgi:hypothetical protein